MKYHLQSSYFMLPVKKFFGHKGELCNFSVRGVVQLIFIIDFLSVLLLTKFVYAYIIESDSEET